VETMEVMAVSSAIQRRAPRTVENRVPSRVHAAAATLFLKDGAESLNLPLNNPALSAGRKESGERQHLKASTRGAAPGNARSDSLPSRGKTGHHRRPCRPGSAPGSASVTASVTCVSGANHHQAPQRPRSELSGSTAQQQRLRAGQRRRGGAAEMPRRAAHKARRLPATKNISKITRLTNTARSVSAWRCQPPGLELRGMANCTICTIPPRGRSTFPRISGAHLRPPSHPRPCHRTGPWSWARILPASCSLHHHRTPTCAQPAPAASSRIKCMSAVLEPCMRCRPPCHLAATGCVHFVAC
jgi:hypothetical protein